MALEKSLWRRLHKTAVPNLVEQGHRVDLRRLENVCEKGTPDVEGCIDAKQVWIELKSCNRPKRAKTPCHPKIRQEQIDWLKTRAAAGCRTCWLLIQVGEAHNARLYLIPGPHAAQAQDVPEHELDLLGVANPELSPAALLLVAARGWRGVGDNG